MYNRDNWMVSIQMDNDNWDQKWGFLTSFFLSFFSSLPNMEFERSLETKVELVLDLKIAASWMENGRESPIECHFVIFLCTCHLSHSNSTTKCGGWWLYLWSKPTPVILDWGFLMILGEIRYYLYLKMSLITLENMNAYTS